jgi:murein L,D-transpeptidase YcbB/YkuD
MGEEMVDMRRGVGGPSRLSRLSVFGLAAAIAAVPLSVGLQAPAQAAASSEYSGAVADFYRSRGGALLWLAPGSRNAAQQLIQQIATAQADNLNPRRYNVRALSRAAAEASRGDPAAVQRADMMLSEAFVAYARDTKHDPHIGIIYVDPELKPAAPPVQLLLDQAAKAPSPGDYVQQMGWMNPIYAQLRQAIASRMYRTEAERRLLTLNLERARALPGGTGRYAIVNAPAARLYMYENGHVVDSMRVVAGRPDPIAQTPMMNAFIRYVALNPYWNAPPDIAARKLAPNVLKRGRVYLKEKGYEILSDWSTDARVIDPMSINWQAVVNGTAKVRMRQKPGPANSMGKMKFMFPNAQGIWLHDTPEREKIEEAARLQSNGCVRLEDAPRFARWLFNGRPPRTQGARPEQKANLPAPIPLYITYLTAVPSGTSIVYFDDFYGKDRVAVRQIASR